MKTTIHTLTMVVDWEPVTMAFPTEDALMAQVLIEAEQAAERAFEPVPEDPDEWPQFIGENGWRVQVFEIEAHEIEVVDEDVPFSWTPEPVVRCAMCGEPIKHDPDAPADSWHDYQGSYPCMSQRLIGAMDHRPADIESAAS